MTRCLHILIICHPEFNRFERQSLGEFMLPLVESFFLDIIVEVIMDGLREEALGRVEFTKSKLPYSPFGSGWLRHLLPFRASFFPVHFHCPTLQAAVHLSCTGKEISVKVRTK